MMQFFAFNTASIFVTACVAVAVLLLAPTAHAYNVGCIYPTEMPEPFEARYRMVELASVGATAAQTETPIVVRNAHATSYCNMNCLAVHDATVLNSLTKERPIISTPPFAHNASSITMCIAECYNVLFGPGNLLQSLFDEWELPVTGLQPQVVAAATAANPTELLNLIVTRDYDPLLLGQLVALEIGAFLSQDGWNSNGAQVYDSETGKAVPCTVNRTPTLRDTLHATARPVVAKIRS